MLASLINWLKPQASDSNRSQNQPKTLDRGMVITVSNLSMGDATEGFAQILKSIPSSAKKLVVEMPCMSVPKLAISLLNTKSIRDMDEKRTMDQLLLDYDRDSLQSIDEYIYKVDQTDCLLLNPRVQPDNSVLKSVQDMQTLIHLPVYIREQVGAAYDYIFFVTQGKLDTATTYFSIRNADANVLILDKPSDWALNCIAHDRMHSTYQIGKERLFYYSVDRKFKEKAKDGVYIWPKQLVQALKKVPLGDFAAVTSNEGTDMETSNKVASIGIGYINPVDFLKAGSQSTATKRQKINSSQINQLTKLAERTRTYLQEHHLDEFVASRMNPEARKKVKFYIADMIRNQPAQQVPGVLDEVIDWVQKEITELGDLQELMDDPLISNIDINGHDRVIIERAGQISHAKHIRFEDNDHLLRIINRMLNGMGKQLTGNSPVVDTVYFGTRICAVLDTQKNSGLSIDAPVVSIRKFPPNVYTDAECVESGNASQELLDFLRFAIGVHASVCTVGATNSGKTSTTIRFPMYVDPLTRIITIEDSPEVLLSSKLQYKDYNNIVALQTKELEDVMKSYPTSRLVRTTMRMSPMILLIGETRDEVGALEMVKAGNTGHVIWTTTHANGCKEGAIRIMQLCGNTPAVAGQIAKALDIFIYQQRLQDGRRVITRVEELVGYKGVDDPEMNVIFTYNFKEDRHMQVGYLKTDKMRNKVNLFSHSLSEHDIKRWCRFKDVNEEFTEVKPYVVA